MQVYRKRFAAKPIGNHLREAEVLPAQAQRVGEIYWRIVVSEQSYNRWRPTPVIDESSYVSSFD